MASQAFEAPAMSPLPPAAGSRPQVGIERLPTRRLSNEPRESMNCKSCRKRKIKCNRLRPACEACQVFQCPCIYDAVPKKRGPKTDVLEALLKRVDGLERRLRDQKKTGSGASTSENGPGSGSEEYSPTRPAEDSTAGNQKDKDPAAVDTARTGQDNGEPDITSPTATSVHSPGVQPEALLDAYFSRFHAKPFHILDESSLRQRLQLNQVPSHLLHAIYAVTARFTHHPGGYEAGVKLSESYAARARGEIDIDEPSVDALQTLLLLVTAFTAAGKGKKAYMLLTSAVGMTMALELHREMDAQARVTSVEREVRRRLFWTCYLIDKFMACGSKRPSLIADKTILLRLPAWAPRPGSLPLEGEFFQGGSNLQVLQGNGKKCQGSSGMLVDISRILGTTNRYLVAGGVKGDSHFPWHSLSNLSKIRQELDVWASGMEDVFSSVDSLFGQPDSTSLVLGKLIYHLIHCLIYRPFLPIDLAELAGPGQHQSWQIEATNMCFLHANAIAELVELGRQAATIEWPAFVGYCICTAGTVHIHGAHYSNNANGGEMSVFNSSAEFLSRAMQHLSELRYTWASVEHQRETLQGIYNAHSELVKSLENNPMRYSPVFHLEDFFDRYSNIGGPGGQTFKFDAANISLSDVTIDFVPDSYGECTGLRGLSSADATGTEPARPNLKRKHPVQSGRKRLERKSLSSLAGDFKQPATAGLPTPSHINPGSFSTGMLIPQSPGMLHTPASITTQHDMSGHQPHMNGLQGSMNDTTADDPTAAAGAATRFALTAQPQPQPQRMSSNHVVPTLSNASFSPQYGYTQFQAASFDPHGQGGHTQSPYDPMFGGVPTNAFSSPAPWHGDEGGNGGGTGTTGTGTGRTPAVPSPGNASHTGSTGTGSADEKDPFLSLLEQLAESESLTDQGNELDFFLAGGSGGG